MHANARLTRRSREIMVGHVVQEGHTVKAAAFTVCEKTVCSRSPDIGGKEHPDSGKVPRVRGTTRNGSAPSGTARCGAGGTGLHQ